MAEEVIQKKTGAERQTEILVAALERARENGGVLLNAACKPAPSFYDKSLRLSPGNTLVMAMHSDAGGFKTNVYTMFRETHDRGEAVRKGQKGVAVVWTNPNQYVNNDNPDDKISRKAYFALDENARKQYKANPREDVYTIFNIDQTTMAHVHKDDYQKQVEQFAANGRTDDKAMRMEFNQFLQKMKDYLVPIRKDGTGLAHYDSRTDTLHIPPQKDFASYPDYAQEVVRQIAHATGVPQRLGRRGVAVEGGRQPDASMQQRELLVRDLVASHKMLEMGLPAKLHLETLEHLPSVIDQLKEDPEVGKAILADVNRTVGMMKKAESGVKILPVEKPSEKSREAWASQFPIDKVPETFSRIAMLKDDNGKWTLAARPEEGRTFAIHPDKADIGMYFDMMKNDHDEASIEKFRTQFAQKYYSVVAEHPDREVNIFKSSASQETLDRIDRVNAFKTNDNKVLLMANIDGEKQRPREISQSQWQRLWLADDKRDYKQHLAATLYADVLSGKQNKEQQTGQQNGQQTVKESTGQNQLPPIMKQFDKLKAKHPDAILLFRAGDFYETYRNDAVKASRILGITLTTNNKVKDKDGQPLETAIFPHHALDVYLPKLIRAGERVAICDQLTLPKQQETQGEEAKDAPQQEVKEVVSRQEEQRTGMHR